MLANERRRIITERAMKEGQVLVNRLSEELNVSDQTIRRDIQYLNDNHVIKKVHGGAVPITKNQQASQPSAQQASQQRWEQYKKEREQLGKYSAQFIEDNDVIALDTGATIDWLAKAVLAVRNVTILISSVTALNFLLQKVSSGDLDCKIIFLGGEINPKTQSAQGNLTLDLLKRFSINKCFITSTSVSTAGIHMNEVSDEALTALLIQRSSEVYYVGISEKFGREALIKVCELQQVQHFITDTVNPIPQDLREAIENAGAKLHLVEC